MKFFTDSVARCAARIGILSGFERIPDITFETPLLLIYTKVQNEFMIILLTWYQFFMFNT
jgi:hypothetical protein